MARRAPERDAAEPSSTRGATDDDGATDAVTEPAPPIDDDVADAATTPTVRFDGNGTYVRDDDGVWRYTGTPQPVPGARDLTLGEAYPALVIPHGGGTYRQVPRRWVPRRTGHPLAWVLAVDGVLEVDDGVLLLVPDDAWREHDGDVVGMLAPELHPQHLVDIDEVAAAAGVGRSTIRAYLARQQMPAPVARVGGSPAWARPVVDQWLAGRRAAAAH